MKLMSNKKKKSYRRRSAEDSRDLTRSAYELCYVLILLAVFGTAIICLCFRLVTFEKKIGNVMTTYCVASMRFAGEDCGIGDMVTVDTGSSVSAGMLIAREGDAIEFGYGDNDVNCVRYENKQYFSLEELKTAVPEAAVPDGYVMLDGDITDSQELCVGEIVRKDYIIGRVRFVIYPFSLFGREAAYISK